MITLKIGWCNILGFWHCTKWELTTVLGMKKIFCKGLISHVFVSNHNFQHCETAREGILISCRNSHYSLLSIDFCFSLFFFFIKKIAFFNTAATPFPALKASSSVSQVLWGLMYWLRRFCPHTPLQSPEAPPVANAAQENLQVIGPPSPLSDEEDDPPNLCKVYA